MSEHDSQVSGELSPADEETSFPEGASRGQRLRAALLPGGILLVGVCTFVVLWLLREAPGRRQQESDRVLVQTAVVPEPVFELPIRLHGVVMPPEEIEVGAEVAGRIVEKTPECRAGNYVEKGTLLLRIDQQKYRLQVEQLRFQLEQVAAELSQLDVEEKNQQALVTIAQEELKLARRELERLDALVKKNVVTEGQRDEAARGVVQAENRLQSVVNTLELIPVRRKRLLAQQKLLQAQLRGAQTDLARTEVRAPVSGLIVAELVQVGDVAQVSAPLLRMIDNSTMEVRCHLEMEHLYWVWGTLKDQGENVPPDRYYEVPPTPAVVEFSIGRRSYRWEGTLSRYEAGEIDSRTHTVPCRVRVPRPRRSLGDGPPALMRGMFVTVVLQVPTKVPLFRLPAAALNPPDTLWMVQQNKLHEVRVEVVQADRETILVRAAPEQLRPGQHVVVSPLPVAYEGMEVERLRTPPSAPHASSPERDERTAPSAAE